MSKNQKEEDLDEEEEDNDIKVILVGEMATGKTSLINSAIGLDFQEKVPSTHSNSIMNKSMDIDGNIYNLDLWDTIGQEKFRALTQIFMKDAKIIIFVYDITYRKTFDELSYWFESTKEVITNDTVLGVVGNKCDLFLNEVVKEDEGKKLAAKHGYEFSLTTAKSPMTFCKFLEKLVRIYIKKLDESGGDIKNTSQKLKEGDSKGKKKCC